LRIQQANKNIKKDIASKKTFNLLQEIKDFEEEQLKSNANSIRSKF